MENQSKALVNPFEALDYINSHAEILGHSKATVLYLTEYRKTIKATLMVESDLKTESAKESFAYSHSVYKEHLKALREAVAEFEALRWKMIHAEATIEVWRSLESTARAEGKATQ